MTGQWILEFGSTKQGSQTPETQTLKHIPNPMQKPLNTEPQNMMR